MNIRFFLSLVFITLANTAAGDAVSTLYTHSALPGKNSSNVNPPPDNKWLTRFRPYDINYMAYSVPVSYDSKDSSLEAQVSLRYDLAESGRVYMHFTNRFDFYVFTRESSPLVVRDAKIGLNFIAIDDLLGSGENNSQFEFGFTHWSNGQRTVVDDAPERPPNAVSSSTYQDAYVQYTDNKNNDNDRALVDSLSRARNYLTLSTSALLTDSLWLSADIKVDVWSEGEEDSVFGNINPEAALTDYDIATFAMKYDFLGRYLIYHLRVGEKLMSTASHDFAFRLCKKFPFIIAYHHGAFQRLSDYTRKINVLSLGFEFSL